MRWILASRSPRRQELLKLILPAFEIHTAHIDESAFDALPVAERCRQLAREKARSVARQAPDAVVIGADTLVELDGSALGKPRDAAHAAQMLHALSGNTHNVHTGVAVCARGLCFAFTETTRVTFRTLETRDIAHYVASGDPMDKAGAYGIQSGAARFVRSISGDYYNVMGLPVCALDILLGAIGAHQR